MYLHNCILLPKISSQDLSNRDQIRYTLTLSCLEEKNPNHSGISNVKAILHDTQLYFDHYYNKGFLQAKQLSEAIGAIPVMSKFCKWP